MPRMDREIITSGDSVDHTLEIVEIEVRLDSLGIQVEGEINEVNVARSFSVSEETTLNAITACKDTKLGRSNASTYDGLLKANYYCKWIHTSVIMRMQANNDLFPFGDVGAEVLDLEGS